MGRVCQQIILQAVQALEFLVGGFQLRRPLLHLGFQARIQGLQRPGLFLQGIHHLVVAFGNVAHLRERIHRHSQMQISLASVAIHHLK